MLPHLIALGCDYPTVYAPKAFICAVCCSVVSKNRCSSIDAESASSLETELELQILCFLFLCLFFSSPCWGSIEGQERSWICYHPPIIMITAAAAAGTGVHRWWKFFSFRLNPMPKKTEWKDTENTMKNENLSGRNFRIHNIFGNQMSPSLLRHYVTEKLRSLE